MALYGEQTVMEVEAGNRKNKSAWSLMSANLKVTPTSLVERDHIAYMEDIAKAN
jgi:hypothetical protein